MSSEPIYYVYLYLRPDNREPFYIGKGCGDRAYDHLIDAYRMKRLHRKHSIIKSIHNKGLDPIIIFPYKNLTEEKAFSVEQSLIAHYGRLDTGTGILANMSDGGEGNRGHRYCSDKRKYKLTNIYTKEIIYVTRLQMREDLGISRSSVCDLFKGRKAKAGEWYFGDIPNGKEFIDPSEKRKFINVHTLEEIVISLNEREVLNFTEKEFNSLVDGRKNSVRGWAYNTLEGKNFKTHGVKHNIINIITKEKFTGTQRDIERKIGTRSGIYGLMYEGKCIRKWILGDCVPEEVLIRHHHDHKFLLFNKKTKEERMMSVNDLKNIGARSKAFEVMRRESSYKGWERTPLPSQS